MANQAVDIRKKENDYKVADISLADWAEKKLQ
jgi:hypothetical protein